MNVEASLVSCMGTVTSNILFYSLWLDGNAHTHPNLPINGRWTHMFSIGVPEAQ